MYITLQAKILLTVLAIVLMFTFFSLQYFPAQQGRFLLKKYEEEVQSQANTIALGVGIALDDQYFAGIQTAMGSVKGKASLKFVALLAHDSVRNGQAGSYIAKDTILASFPENVHPDIGIASNDSLIVKRAPFHTQMLTGDILLVFSTREIRRSKRIIRTTSLLISCAIFIVGMLIGLWLARNISQPVQAIRNAANMMGRGDVAPEVKSYSRDEIGDLAKSFNAMVLDVRRLSELSISQEKEKQQILSTQNEALERRVEKRTTELRKSLENLKSAQSQLIQSEKMASLGQLTAGIAHEIQNPLNFVNNFSEVNLELIGEMKEELAMDNKEAANKIGDNIKDNEEKINYHGKRADAIVKGMLQHSRNTTGAREPVDINTLAQEYLRLSYHGYRAKDKAFNATIKTDLDNDIGLVNVIPQDIGRALLNLYNNAFYAVHEKMQSTSAKATADKPSSAEATEGKSDRDDASIGKYEPTVTLTTIRKENEVSIIVGDNGIGIPQEIVDKIFQPFFTTKPTGQGTGLGLSLTYDIIVKGHGGKLSVNTKEGEGTKFTVIIPV